MFLKWLVWPAESWWSWISATQFFITNMYIVQYNTYNTYIFFAKNIQVLTMHNEEKYVQIFPQPGVNKKTEITNQPKDKLIII